MVGKIQAWGGTGHHPLKKAFDTVNYQILLRKLEKCGIRSTVKSLLISYLYGRKIRTKIKDVKSTEKDVLIRVPQGTILGPLLFVIYINDIPDSCILYADDTVVSSVADTWRIAERNMNETLASFDTWFIANILSLNFDKTVFLTFGTYKDSLPQFLNVSIRNNIISRVDKCKYLGVHIDCCFRWGAHVDHIIHRTKYLIFVFHKLGKILSKNCPRMLYFALFQSI